MDNERNDKQKEADFLLHIVFVSYIKSYAQTMETEIFHLLQKSIGG